MAMAAVLDDTEEKSNGTKLARLLIDDGTETLRRTLDSVFSPADLQANLRTHKVLLTSLQRRKILNNSQWDMLYLPSGAAPYSKTFDITLLFVLLRNICGLAAPATGWDALPHAADVSREANLVRIKFYRNQVYAHVAGAGVSRADFEQYWSDISGALIALGADQVSIDLLKSSTIGETEYLSLLNKWKTEDEKFKEEIKRMEETLKELISTESKRTRETIEENKQKQQPDSKASQTELLSQCEFTGHLTSLNNRYHQGTRLQLMNYIKVFCTDSKVSSEALVITALPGVGKTVLAAVICKELREKGTLGACHFIQYNNSQRNNPRVIIESIAHHLCDNVDGFKDKLDRRLFQFQDVRKELNEMNLETLVSVLLEDPLNKIERLPKNHFVIVIDALDECEPSTRDELVKVLFSKLFTMPRWIKFVLTSRPNKQLTTELPLVTIVDITTTDTNNTNDIQLFLSSHLGKMFPDETCEQREAVVSNLTARSGGLFLYAHYSVESAKRGRLSLSAINEIFPKGISSVYEEYVTRLQVELKVEEELFMNFLEAVVASQATLPESLVLQILGLKQTTRQEKKRAREALKSLGLLFPVVEKHISIFHKSLTDWLTEDGGKDEGHVFSVKLQDGHFVLAKHCFRVLQDVKKHACFPPELNDSEKYSLKFGIHHILEDGGYKEQLKSVYRIVSCYLLY